MSENKKIQATNSLTPKEAFKLIKEHKNDSNWIILDVRTPWEYAEAHIEGAKNLDYTDPDFYEILEKLDKEKNYVIYCKSGQRSGKVLEMIKKLGFTRVYNIKGGYEAWKSSKY
jgi:rhodanese-related sulfurtransferase